ncbi:MAG: hypothetical protein V7646_6685 [Pseudonocardia sp.]
MLSESAINGDLAGSARQAQTGIQGLDLRGRKAVMAGAAGLTLLLERRHWRTLDRATLDGRPEWLQGRRRPSARVGQQGAMDTTAGTAPMRSANVADSSLVTETVQVTEL